MQKYIKDHLAGEHSLVRSYWINSVLLSNAAIIAVALVFGFTWGLIISIAGFDNPPDAFWGIITYIAALPIVYWSLVGTWKSAGKYQAAKGGLLNWGGIARLLIVFGALKFVLYFFVMLR